MLGGFAPLPLRLGGTETDGFTAPQHARLAADLAAAVRTCPFAWVTYTSSGGGVTINSYNGMNGVGLSHAPTAVRNSAGNVTLTWSASYEDSYEIGEPVNLRHAKPNAHGATPIRGSVVSVARNVVRIAMTNKTTDAAADCKVTVVVY